MVPFEIGGWENVIDKPGNRVPCPCRAREICVQCRCVFGIRVLLLLPLLLLLLLWALAPLVSRRCPIRFFLGGIFFFVHLIIFFIHLDIPFFNFSSSPICSTVFSLLHFSNFLKCPVFHFFEFLPFCVFSLHLSIFSFLVFFSVSSFTFRCHAISSRSFGFGFQNFSFFCFFFVLQIFQLSDPLFQVLYNFVIFLFVNNFSHKKIHF